MHELMALQGFQPSWLRTSCVSEAALGKMIGNAMSPPVMAAVLAAALPACGL